MPDPRPNHTTSRRSFLGTSARVAGHRPGRASLAKLTPGGHGLAPDELPNLLQQLQSRQNEFEEEIVTKISLWDRWPVFLALVGLLSLEWWLRKRWGLV